METIAILSENILQPKINSIRVFRVKDIFYFIDWINMFDVLVTDSASPDIRKFSLYCDRTIYDDVNIPLLLRERCNV